MRNKSDLDDLLINGQILFTNWELTEDDLTNSFRINNNGVNVIYLEDGNGFVGINKSNPARILDIIGNNMALTSSSGDAQLIVSSPNENAVIILDASTGGGGTDIQKNAVIKFNSIAQTRATIGFDFGDLAFKIEIGNDDTFPNDHFVLTPTELSISGNIFHDKQTVYFTEELTAGTNGGTFTAGTQTRNLTHRRGDLGFTSFGTDQFTITLAGDYHFHFSAPAYRVDNHQIQLYNVSDSAIEEVGTSEFSFDITGGAVQSRSFLNYLVTVTANDIFSIRHFAQSTKTTNGFGLEAGNSTEIYTQGWIRKIN